MTYSPTPFVTAVRFRFVSRLCSTTVASVTTAPPESRTVPLTVAVACAQEGEAENANTNTAAKINVNITIHRSCIFEKTWHVIIDPPRAVVLTCATRFRNFQRRFPSRRIDRPPTAAYTQNPTPYK